MKNAFALLMTFVLTAPIAYASDRVQAEDCPASFLELTELASKYETDASRLYPENPARAAKLGQAAHSLKRILVTMGQGTREDLGESPVLSYVVMNESELKKLNEHLKRFENAYKDTDLAGEILPVLSGVLETVPRVNLLGRAFDLAKAACLGGTAYLTLVEEHVYSNTEDFKEVEISDYSAQADTAWVAAIENLVRDEENLWWDTILEGDISKSGPAKAEAVSVVLFRGQRVLTNVFIQAPGVMTANGDCEYSDAEDKWVGEGCATGSIYVTKYLDAHNKSVGSMDFAEFD